MEFFYKSIPFRGYLLKLDDKSLDKNHKEFNNNNLYLPFSLKVEDIIFLGSLFILSVLKFHQDLRTMPLEYHIILLLYYIIFINISNTYLLYLLIFLIKTLLLKSS